MWKPNKFLVLLCNMISVIANIKSGNLLQLNDFLSDYVAITIHHQSLIIKLFPHSLAIFVAYVP